MDKVRMVLWIIWATCRRPPSLKAAWTLALVWGFASVLPALSIGLNPARGLDLTIWVGWCNLFSLSIDAPMLYISIRGLLWRRALERWRRNQVADGYQH